MNGGEYVTATQPEETGTHPEESKKGRIYFEVSEVVGEIWDEIKEFEKKHNKKDIIQHILLKK